MPVAPTRRLPDRSLEPCILLLLCSLLACRGKPGTALQKPLGPVYPVAQQGCARFQVEVRGKETIAVEDDSAFVTASGAACGGVRPVLAGTPVYDGPADRVRIPMALANQTAQPFRAPARLYGWEDSLTVLEAPGLAQNEWTADYLDFLSPDSALDATDPQLPGAVLWRYDTLLSAQPPKDELAAGASSQVRWVELAVHSGVLKFQLVLYAEAADADTSRPAVPPVGPYPFDSTLVVPHPDDASVLYFRNILIVAFEDSATGPAIRTVLQRYHATIIGGIPQEGRYGTYLIQVPDPGTRWEDLESLRNMIVREPAVRWVSGVTYRGKLDPRYRLPIDGVSHRRADWVLGSPSLRPWMSVRAPLAWGCETGAYTNTEARLGVIDFTFDNAHPDFQGSQIHLVLPTAPTIPSAFLTDPTPDGNATAGAIYRSHGTAVAGILAATGDNGEGIAGMVWGGDLHLFAYGHDTVVVNDPVSRLTVVFDSAARAGIPVLLTSVGAGFIKDTTHVSRLAEALEGYLSASPSNTFVMATGNYSAVISVSALQTTQDARATALDAAAARLYSRYPGQIIFVAGADGSNYYASSNVWEGATQIAAPAVDIETLARINDFPGGTSVRTGTSYSAPFVAGAIAQLLTFDPTLTAVQVKDLLLRGAQVPRFDPQTGTMVTPQQLGAGPPGVYQLDAYGALSLLSRERPGTPLCGTHVWTANGQLLARQGSGVEVLAELGEAAGLVNVRHGGRRIDLVGAQNFDREFLYDAGSRSWQEGTPFTLPDTLWGGTYLSSLFVSHDNDSAVRVLGSSTTTFDIQLYSLYHPGWTSLTSLPVSVNPGSGSDCFRQERRDTVINGQPTVTPYECTAALTTASDVASARPAFDPRGGRVVVAVNRMTTTAATTGPWLPCPFTDTIPGTTDPRALCKSYTQDVRSTGGTLWEVRTASPTPHQLGSFPAQMFWLGLAEAGGELVAGEGLQEIHTELVVTAGGFDSSGSYSPTRRWAGISGR